ncbi:hypothetical protein EGW08_008202 [Elysia chlorotica]|uniref:Translocator protein n=1 Tax=Elysia chlorotica TaxID=188477 RepID=A0A3S0ZVL2_ELYCH|nr:hypothetical protein EGW08_008202 [Elysia chlorotica]
MSDYMKPAAAVILPFVGGFAGGIVTRKNIPTWYEGLKHPSWRPPNKVFGPVWSLLYGSMGYASYLVWRDGGGFGGDAAVPLALYGTQLALNWVWTPIFFGAHSLKWAFVDIVAMWGAIAGTIFTFHGINETASYLLVPYLGWVTFAGALNFWHWRNNPSIEEKKD